VLKESGKKIQVGRADRTTDFGRFGLFFNDQCGAIVELKCESAPVAQNEEFVTLANNLAEQLATGPGANSGEELLGQPSPGKKGLTLGEQKDDLFNRIREVFNVGRITRFNGRCGGYLHPGTNVHGVLLQANGGTVDQLKDIAMHVAAMSPAALNVSDLDPAEVEKERAILRQATLNEGKPEKIVDKIVEGKLKSYFAERVLLEQPFVKDSALSVGQYAEQHGITVTAYVHWVLGSA
jgi:elongation factor Ts